MTFAEISPVVGSSYKPLPKELEERRENGIDNIDNSKGGCQQCYKWSQTRNKFRPKKKPRKEKNVVTKKLRKQSEKLIWDGINYPTSLFEIDIFDNLNKISTVVLGWDEDKKRVIYLLLPKTKHKETSQLFYYDKHYSSVRSMSTLTDWTSRQSRKIRFYSRIKTRRYFHGHPLSRKSEQSVYGKN